VINHRKPMAPQLASLAIDAPGFVFSTTHTAQHLEDLVELMAPQGRLGLIDDPEGLNVGLLKQKALSLHWEYMFTRPVFGTPDMGQQSKLLNEVASLVDEGRIRSTITETAGQINASNLKQVHSKIESNTARGKIVLEGF